MRTPQDFGIPFPNDLPNVPTGLGLMYVAHADGIVTIGHGGTLQHHTEFLLDFDNGIGVFVSGNSIMASAASTPIANAILRAAVEEKTGQTLQPSDPRNLAPVTNAQQLIGFYNSMHLTGTLEIVLCEDGNPQILGIPGLPIPLPLTLAQDGSFESFAGRFWFQEIEGIMFMFIGTNFGHTMVGERVYIEPVSPSFAWAGVYQSHDDNGNVSTMTVNVNENGLAYVEQYGIMFMINEVDANNFHAPGRIRLFGSIFEFGMDGDTAYVRYSGHIYTRVADVPAPEAPAETSTQSQLRFVIGDTAYTINGTTRHMESAPFMDTTYDRTMVPLRVIADIFGAEVDWISQTRTVTIVLGDLNLEISADSPLPGGMGLPHNVGGNIFVPLRYVAYAFGVDVRWDGANQAAYIYLAH
ncbi:MAG: copper amine oxidase N-terminal domain-containing protein, partial [Defluviitaleaceae bacterium]|nr:copper amine oxidase N-terminal domain-containing protein [Defluviitaleaceae bacterium]